MTTAQAATRLRVDSSRVVAYIRHGLTKAGYGKNLYLRATRSGRGREWEITPQAVADFRKLRKAWGL